MITLKSPDELRIMRDAGRIVAEIISKLGEMCKDGVTTMDLEKKAVEMILNFGAKPAFPMVRGYKHALCTSVNESVVHEIPSVKRVLRAGDVISIDCGVNYEGLFGDHAWTFAVGVVKEDVEKLMKVGEKCLWLGIDQCNAGKRLYDVSAAIQQHAQQNGFSVVRDYVGHGIGRQLHEEPQVPNFGEANTGLRLRSGMVLALEPMVNMGGWEVEVLNDGWTVVTKDRKPSVHFEHMVAITSDGNEVLSRL